MLLEEFRSAHDKKTKKELVIPAQAGIQRTFIIAKPFLDPSLRWDDRDFFFLLCAAGITGDFFLHARSADGNVRLLFRHVAQW